MDVKEAVQTAKKYVFDILCDEDIQDLATEEVVHRGGTWRVTVSFYRPPSRVGIASALTGSSWKDRSFKVIEVDQGGAVVSMTHRTFPASD